ncbi:hypothetical protein BC829DRAFT_400260 [Chytridium lagenaria]|nr:hypothetical protein BC829DRAFT_400260 [Chytridium lagenaria]
MADERVWENPYFPLTGPPRNEQEKEILKERIRNERDQTRGELASFRNRDMGIESMAASNCADVQWELQECLRSNTLSGWAGLCRIERRKLKECLFVQKEILQSLGFHKLPDHVTPRERMLMAERADQIYLDRLKQKEQESQASPK